MLPAMDGGRPPAPEDPSITPMYPRSDSLSGRATIAVAAVLCAALCGCDDPNTMFTGTWASEGPEGEGSPGAPVVALGHYGREVAGVVYFQRTPVRVPLMESCPCAFVDHRSVDLDRRTVRFVTECEGDVALDWELRLEERGEELRLEGEVRPVDGSGAATALVLVRQEPFVRADDRTCTPERR